VKIWDLRSPKNPLRKIDTDPTHKLRSFSGHETMPLFCTGSFSQFVKVYDMNSMELLKHVRQHEGFLGQRIGPVSSVEFHPLFPLLAVGTEDQLISIYGNY
jgi:regulator-associated protein of mTOR